MKYKNADIDNMKCTEKATLVRIFKSYMMKTLPNNKPFKSSLEQDRYKQLVNDLIQCHSYKEYLNYDFKFLNDGQYRRKGYNSLNNLVRFKDYDFNSYKDIFIKNLQNFKNKFITY